MMKKLFSMISMVLALTMTGSILASCNKPGENETNQTTETEKTEPTETGSADTVETEGKTDYTEPGSQTETETETKTETKTETETERFSGKERHLAIKRFKKLQKQFPGIEAKSNI